MNELVVTIRGTQVMLDRDLAKLYGVETKVEVENLNTKYLASNSLMFERFERIEQRLTLHDEKFDTIFKTLEDKSINPTQGIFYDGQREFEYVREATLDE